MVAFQRGPAVKQKLQIQPERDRVLKNAPSKMLSAEPIGVSKKKQSITPKFASTIESGSFNPDVNITSKARSLNFAWVASRARHHAFPASWSVFNQLLSPNTSPVSTIGYLPIVDAPPGDLDTVWTVILRCQRMSSALGIRNTVITFDQALYCKAKEIVWLKPKECKDVVIRLGAFHTAMVYLNVIGQHITDSGFVDALVESGTYSGSTANSVLNGKCWNRAVRAHKLFYEVLFRLLLQEFEEDEAYLESNRDLYSVTAYISTAVDSSNPDVPSVPDVVKEGMGRLQSVRASLDDFLAKRRSNPTFDYWIGYLEMVELLLSFIRADRDGQWCLHLNSLKEMMPFICIYDHHNYTRWLPIYLADMMQLPETAPDVYHEFMKGNFVVKRSNSTFNQVPSDQAIEFVNRESKALGGLVGITKVETAKKRWLLTLCDRTKMSCDCRSLVGVSRQEEVVSCRHKEDGKKRSDQDRGDVFKIKEELRKYRPFQREGRDLVCTLRRQTCDKVQRLNQEEQVQNLHHHAPATRRNHRWQDESC